MMGKPSPLSVKGAGSCRGVGGFFGKKAGEFLIADPPGRPAGRARLRGGQGLRVGP